MCLVRDVHNASNDAWLRQILKQTTTLTSTQRVRIASCILPYTSVGCTLLLTIIQTIIQTIILTLTPTLANDAEKRLCNAAVNAQVPHPPSLTLPCTSPSPKHVAIRWVFLFTRSCLPRKSDGLTHHPCLITNSCENENYNCNLPLLKCQPYISRTSYDPTVTLNNTLIPSKTLNPSMTITLNLTTIYLS